MLTRTQLVAILFLAVVLWAIVLLVYGVPVSLEQLKPFGTIIGLVSSGLFVFDRWAWRWRVFRPWLVSRPDIRGTWRLELESDWVDPQTGKTIPTIEGFVSVHQTYSNLTLRLMTDESASDLIAEEIIRRKDNSYELAAIYLNTPKAIVRDRSEIHHGGMILAIHGTPPQTIDGNYWTSRRTTGQIRLSDRVPQVYTSVDAARASRKP